MYMYSGPLHGWAVKKSCGWNVTRWFEIASGSLVAKFCRETVEDTAPKVDLSRDSRRRAGMCSAFGSVRAPFLREEQSLAGLARHRGDACSL